MFLKNEVIENKLDEYFNKWVPEEGKCDHLAGEIIRAIGKISYRYYNDGDKIGVGYGNETCNAAARFLRENVYNKEVEETINHIWGMNNDSVYDFNLNFLSEIILNYIDEHPELGDQKTENMDEYYNPYEDNDL